MNLQEEPKLMKNERIMHAPQVTQKVNWINLVYSIQQIETWFPSLPSVPNYFGFYPAKRMGFRGGAASVHSARKFASRCLPCTVRMLSGWNCTP